MPGSEFWKALPSMDGPQLVVALVVAALIIGFFAARFFFVSGKDKLVAQQGEKQDAISVLKEQVVALTSRIDHLERENTRKDAEAERDRRYRHWLANMSHVFQTSYQMLLDIHRQALAEWGEDMPNSVRLVGMIRGV